MVNISQRGKVHSSPHCYQRFLDWALNLGHATATPCRRYLKLINAAWLFNVWSKLAYFISSYVGAGNVRPSNGDILQG
jgi:hypothetical protein